MTFEETLQNDLELSESFLAEHHLENEDGDVILTVFFADEESAQTALEMLEPLNYRVTYSDRFEDPDFPIWRDFSKPTQLTKQKIESVVRELLATLKSLPFDFNNFALFVGNDEGNSSFFRP